MQRTTHKYIHKDSITSHTYNRKADKNNTAEHNAKLIHLFKHQQENDNTAQTHKHIAT